MVRPNKKLLTALLNTLRMAIGLGFIISIALNIERLPNKNTTYTEKITKYTPPMEQSPTTTSGMKGA